MNCPECNHTVRRDDGTFIKPLELAQCPACHAFLDVYKALAAIQLNKPYAQITNEERMASKRANWLKCYS